MRKNIRRFVLPLADPTGGIRVRFNTTQYPIKKMPLRLN